MLENLSVQKRVLIAITASLLFFVAFDLIFSQKNSQTGVQTEQPKEMVQPQKNAAPLKAESAKLPGVSAAGGKAIATVRSKHFDIEIDELGRIAQVYLKDPQYLDKDKSFLPLFDSAKLPKPLEIRFVDEGLNNEAFKTPYIASVSQQTIEGTPVRLTLTQTLSSAVVTKDLTFYPDGHYDVKISIGGDQKYFVSPGYRPSASVDGYMVHGALIKEADDTISIIEDGDAKGSEKFGGAKIVSAFDRYYTTVLYNFERGMDVFVSKDDQDNPLLFVEGSKEFLASGFVGPKDHRLLKIIDPRLTSIIEYGFFTILAAPLFSILLYLYGLLGNWGWAIVALTALVRIALYPLTYKGMVSMQKLKELAPKMKEIQQKYKGDPQKLNTHMMELYKKHGANPMGGCLPLILQIPIFFAIYRVLLNAIELKGAEWILWIDDLSVMDPYFILPILMGASMFVQQRITPTNFTDPIQEKIFKYMPIIFTFFFVTFPAGLTLYWFVSNLFSIGQQHIINRVFEARRKAKDIE